MYKQIEKEMLAEVKTATEILLVGGMTKTEFGNLIQSSLRSALEKMVEEIVPEVGSDDDSWNTCRYQLKENIKEFLDN